MLKKFKKFCESISGTELMGVGGHVGPGYGDEQLPVTLSKSDTEVVFSYISNQFYSKDDYDNLYQDYLKDGGKPLENGFNRENLDTILSKSKKFENSSEAKRYPKEVNQDDFFNKRGLHRSASFSQIERRIMYDIINKSYARCSISDDFTEIWHDGIVDHTLISKFSDEWFTIITTSWRNGNKFYIADGFEEIETFLKKKIKRKYFKSRLEKCYN